MNTHIYVKLTRPEGYEDVHPDLVIEDAGIKHVFKPEDATGEVDALRQRINEPVKTATGGQSHYCTKDERCAAQSVVGK
jgi:hypothetical protein